VLKDKLHYNNDLYKRIYENLVEIDRHERSTHARLQAIRPISSTTAKKDAEKGLNDQGLAVALRKSTGPDSLVLQRGSTVLAAKTPGANSRRFFSYAVSKQKQLVFASTSDNYIFVYENGLKETDTINMGARVTALHCYDGGERTILYFGTASGYIGYIVYEADKKNQPVFENKLESEITAIEVFHQKKDPDKAFLLAAAKESSPRVYKLDNAYLKPDKLLWGNELPYDRKEYGTIQDAWYDEPSNRVVLATVRNGAFSWNPFTEELLKWLDKRRPDPASAPHLQFYK
jgi:hypothetical protein